MQLYSYANPERNGFSVHTSVCVRKLVEFVDKFDQILDHHFLNDTSTRTKIGTHLLN